MQTRLGNSSICFMVGVFDRPPGVHIVFASATAASKETISSFKHMYHKSPLDRCAQRAVPLTLLLIALSSK